MGTGRSCGAVVWKCSQPTSASGLATGCGWTVRSHAPRPAGTASITPDIYPRRGFQRSSRRRASGLDEDLGWIGRVHRRTDVALGYGLHPQEAAVVRGMVLGDRSLIPERVGRSIPAQRHNTRSGDIRAARRRARGRDLLLLRTFAVPAATRILTTLALMWLYILVAGAPPSAIRPGSSPARARRRDARTPARAAPLMTTMLAAVLSTTSLLVYNAGLLSVSAVFGILLLEAAQISSRANAAQTLRKAAASPLEPALGLSGGAERNHPDSRVELRRGVGDRGPHQPPRSRSRARSSRWDSSARFWATSPLRSHTFWNASNGFLVTLLVWIARAASSSRSPPQRHRGDTTPRLALLRGMCPLCVLCLRKRSTRECWQAPLVGATVLVMWVVLWLRAGHVPAAPLMVRGAVVGGGMPYVN